jgi:hypothetical protein
VDPSRLGKRQHATAGKLEGQRLHAADGIGWERRQLTESSNCRRAF